MFARVYINVHQDPDPGIALVQNGLLCLLEVWIGTIVACMPTMAPIFSNYMKPIFSKLSDRLLRRSASSTDMPAPLDTFMGSGTVISRRRFRKAYNELSRQPTQEHCSCDDLPLVPPPAQLFTECVRGESVAPPDQRGIHVQQHFHTQTV